jgi:hypothetical protein
MCTVVNYSVRGASGNGAVLVISTLYSRHHMRCRASELEWGQSRRHLVHTTLANCCELSYL